MITKRQYCMHILDKFAKMESKPIEQVQEDDILKSSSLAVAMEYLDLLKTPTLKEYAAERGGIVILCVDPDTRSIISLTTREMLDLLPE